MNIYANSQRRNDDRRFRRRMHAIPAAIALLLLGIVWLLSEHSVHAEVKVTNEAEQEMPNDHKASGGVVLQQQSLTYRQDVRSAVPIATNE